MSKTLLVLEDGTIITGKSAASKKDTFGEVVFNTSMTGYEEAFTDSSYAGQILLMTYPLIGNYGFYKKNFESAKVQIRGLILREPYFFSHRGKNLLKFLQENNIPCIWGIDTRALTLKIRQYGTLKGAIINRYRLDSKRLIQDIAHRPHPDTENLVNTVSCKKIILHENHRPYKIALIDCGVKKSILKELKKFATVIQVPFDIDSKTIDSFKPSGIVISNGPGNPEHPEIKKTTIRTIQKLIGKYPIFGICLGHQLLGSALGLKTYKLKFGHRGSNHGVKELSTGRVYITAQNHGYAIRHDHIREIRFDWINVNDGTIEGLSHKHLPVFSVQFHPEAGPGPFDTKFLFKKFINYCAQAKRY